MTILTDKGNYILLSIVKRHQEDETTMYWDEEMLTFDKRFNNTNEVESFIATTLFHNVFKAVESASKNKQIW